MPEGLPARLKRLLVGRPIPPARAEHERLSRVTGLAVLSSDPLSSVAYATEQILRVPGLIAAAALLIDYVLTVAVSIAAGVAAITSALPQWHVNRVEVALALVGLLAIGNLRGVRESGRLFAAPTYVFIASMLALIGVGLWHVASGAVQPVAALEPMQPLGHPLTAFLLLTAFANGCTAMTGVEAVSNGVPAFRPPEARNAAATMITMAVVSITMFLGVTILAWAYRIVRSGQERSCRSLRAACSVAGVCCTESFKPPRC